MVSAAPVFLSRVWQQFSDKQREAKTSKTMGKRVQNPILRDARSALIERVVNYEELARAGYGLDGAIDPLVSDKGPPCFDQGVEGIGAFGVALLPLLLFFGQLALGLHMRLRVRSEVTTRGVRLEPARPGLPQGETYSRYQHFYVSELCGG